MREYDVDSGMSLYKLREYIDRELGFSPDQMTVFETLSAAGKISRRIGLFDFGDGSMDRITINNTVSHEETVLRYVYNLTLSLCIELRLEGEQEPNRRLSYPVLVAEKGRNPDQFSAAYEDYEEFSDRRASQAAAPDEEDSFEEDELPEGEENL